MINIIQTPAEEIELTDAQLEAVCGAWDQGNDNSFLADLAGNDPDDEFAPSEEGTFSSPAASASNTPHIFFFKKDKKTIFFKKDDKVKVLKIG